MKVEINGDVIRVAFMNSEWLEDKLVKQRFLVHEQVVCGSQKDPVVITASTRELQSFVLTFAQDSSAFENLFELRRVEEKE